MLGEKWTVFLTLEMFLMKWNNLYILNFFFFFTVSLVKMAGDSSLNTSIPDVLKLNIPHSHVLPFLLVSEFYSRHRFFFHIFVLFGDHLEIWVPINTMGVFSMYYLSSVTNLLSKYFWNKATFTTEKHIRRTSGIDKIKPQMISLVCS